MTLQNMKLNKDIMRNKDYKAHPGHKAHGAHQVLLEKVAQGCQEPLANPGDQGNQECHLWENQGFQEHQEDQVVQGPQEKKATVEPTEFQDPEAKQDPWDILGQQGYLLLVNQALMGNRVHQEHQVNEGKEDCQDPWVFQGQRGKREWESLGVLVAEGKQALWADQANLDQQE